VILTNHGDFGQSRGILPNHWLSHLNKSQRGTQPPKDVFIISPKSRTSYLHGDKLLTIYSPSETFLYRCGVTESQILGDEL